ncbi:MAG: protein-glutamate O-methyltransferase CheR [Leptolyngbyaceae bacterium]|nr:protein-glutamate O-methyltransferase CheR [Leptolyngbyaceae bacterium]
MTNTDNSDQTFEDLLDYLRQNRGFDFTGYKRSTLMRRVQKRMASCNIKSFALYLDFLQVHPEEFPSLLNTILINVTAFLRDQEAWTFLLSEALPRLIGFKAPTAPIRVWSAGCASGEEPYSIAMGLMDILGMDQFRQRVKIYATDVDDEALTQARQANYRAEDLANLPDGWRETYFDPIGDRYAVRPDLRRGVIYGRHDLVHDAPISRLDLLICRNTLMYFNAETQRNVLNHFHFALRDEGLLFLGKAEMLLTHGDRFVPINLSHRLFRRVPSGDRRTDLFALQSALDPEVDPMRTDPFQSLQQKAFDVGLEAQIVVNAVRACLRGQSYEPETVVEATNRRGRTIQCRVSIHPLLGSEQERYGVILLMEVSEL